MGRKVDPARREQLLAATAAYLEANGLTGLSLRPLGAALGVSPRTLLYHFGSKEQLLTEALNAAPGLKAAVDEFVASGEPLFDRVRRLWERTADPDSRPYLSLFFEVYAAALREPQRYATFLSGVVDGWLALLTPMLERKGLLPLARRRSRPSCSPSTTAAPSICLRPAIYAGSTRRTSPASRSSRRRRSSSQ